MRSFRGDGRAASREFFRSNVSSFTAGGKKAENLSHQKHAHLSAATLKSDAASV